MSVLELDTIDMALAYGRCPNCMGIIDEFGMCDCYAYRDDMEIEELTEEDLQEHCEYLREE
ncbi:MAG: hypothetical protein KKD77_23190 [Gammaproteobacteria bacterium]|nr:hypothetical protein [Gammaproteobacteria bacterium]